MLLNSQSWLLSLSLAAKKVRTALSLKKTDPEIHLKSPEINLLWNVRLIPLPLCYDREIYIILCFSVMKRIEDVYFDRPLSAGYYHDSWQIKPLYKKIIWTSSNIRALDYEQCFTVILMCIIVISMLISVIFKVILASTLNFMAWNLPLPTFLFQPTFDIFTFIISVKTSGFRYYVTKVYGPGLILDQNIVLMIEKETNILI